MRTPCNQCLFVLQKNLKYSFYSTVVCVLVTLRYQKHTTQISHLKIILLIEMENNPLILMLGNAFYTT